MLKSFLDKAMVDCKKLTFQLIITKTGSKFLMQKIDEAYNKLNGLLIDC
jgi:hypothetical protein